MKREFTLLTILFSCVVLIGMWGCVDYEEPKEDEVAQTRAMDAFEEAVYHEETDSWITPNPDPYALGNFQKAYDNLVSGRSVRTLTPEIAEELAQLNLQATHYNVKIFPKSEVEQRAIELTEGVTVSYIPFDYIQMPEEESRTMRSFGAQAVYPEKGYYTQTFEDHESTEGAVESFTITLPILYAVWPCDKPFPAGMHYEILYEVFLPEKVSNERSLSLLSNAMQILEQEAVNLASGGRNRASRSWLSATARGGAYNYDTQMKTHVPVANLKVRYQVGSQVWETYTESDGKFFIRTPIPANANLSFIFQHQKWTITRENSTAACTIPWGRHADRYPNASYYGGYSIPIFEVHRAVNFYYNEPHNVPTWHYPSGMRVIVLDYRHPDFAGLFSYFKDKNAYITISDGYHGNEGHIIGTVLHELGHWSQYRMKGFSAFRDCQNLLKESWASYVGWYLGELYYTYLGWVKPADDSSNITGQARQNWVPVFSDYYSPLFVDLRDSYEQEGSGDVIENVSFSVINDIGAKASDWSTCRALIRSHLGANYSNAVLDAFFAPYNAYINPDAIVLYPNPVTSGTLNIRVGGGIYGDATIKIYDAAARLVYTANQSELHNFLTFNLDVSSLASGMYSLKLNYTGKYTHPSGTATGSFIKV